MANLSIKTGTISRSMLVGNPSYVPPAFESIATAVGTGSSNTITFSSIPSTYKHLQIRWIAKDDYTGGVNAASTIELRLNGDTGSNYTRHQLYGDGSAVTALGAASVSTIRFDYAGALGLGTANVFGAAIVDIHDYASTTKNKTVRGFYGCNANTSDTNYAVGLASGLWMNTNAVTSISLIDGYNFTTSSVFSLYGIKG